MSLPRAIEQLRDLCLLIAHDETRGKCAVAVLLRGQVASRAGEDIGAKRFARHDVIETAEAILQLLERRAEFLAPLRGFPALINTGEEFGRISGFLDLNPELMQLLWAELADLRASAPDFLSASRRLLRRERFDRHGTAGDRQGIVRGAPWAGLDPLGGVENERAKACRLDRFPGTPIALETLPREH